MSSHVEHEKKFKKHESVNLIRLKQTTKLKTMENSQNEKTTEEIQRADKSFSLNLLLLVNETARVVKILNAISTIETQRVERMFYPYRPHRNHLTACYSTMTKFNPRSNENINIRDVIPL